MRFVAGEVVLAGVIAPMSKPIYFFCRNEPYDELSNFYPCGFEDEGVYWPTVEHYFQAQKFQGDQYAGYRELIRQSGSPQHAKMLGRSARIPLRSDWETVKEEVMLYALRRKFENPAMRRILLETKNRRLIENSPYDKYWGIGKDGRGKNRLGELLMKVRAEIQVNC